MAPATPPEVELKLNKFCLNVCRVIGCPTPQNTDQRVKPNSRLSPMLNDSFWPLYQGLAGYEWPESLPSTRSKRYVPNEGNSGIGCGLVETKRRLYVGSALLEKASGPIVVGPQ